jgi:uncharacterized protein (DUF2249 family)
MISGQINRDTKVSVLLKAGSEVVEALVALHPHFNKLRNPFLRKMLASRVSIADACKIAGCDIRDFMAKMVELGFTVNEADAEPSPEAVRVGEENPPSFERFEPVELDVRPVLAAKEDPLKVILKAAENLNPDQCLKLVNTFEPLPLITLLAKKGFSHATQRLAPDLVITWFAQSAEVINTVEVEEFPAVNSNEDFVLACQQFGPERIETINVRHLEMPLPMVTVLQHLEKLPAHKALFVLHKKVPVHLLSELKARGFTYLIQTGEENIVNLLIYRP